MLPTLNSTSVIAFETDLHFMMWASSTIDNLLIFFLSALPNFHQNSPHFRNPTFSNHSFSNNKENSGRNEFALNSSQRKLSAKGKEDRRVRLRTVEHSVMAYKEQILLSRPSCVGLFPWSAACTVNHALGGAFLLQLITREMQREIPLWQSYEICWVDRNR